MTDAEDTFRALRALSTELGNPGVEGLFIAARRKGLDVTKAEVRSLVRSDGAKQVFAPVQRSQGRSVAESIDARWQMDLIDLYSQPQKGLTAIVVAVNCLLHAGGLREGRGE